MAEGIQSADGKPLDVDPAKADTNREFAAAMAAPAGDDKAPPRKAPREQTQTQDKPRVRKGRPPGSTSKPKETPPAALSREQKLQGIQGIVQLGAGGCLLAERATGSKSFKADAITLASSADAIAQAVIETAEIDERFSRVVDKICTVGPYGALLTVALSVGTQIARNHGANMPGTQDPDELIKLAEQEPVAA